MIDSDVLNSDVTLTGVMEGKTFTITIKSNNSNNQTRTYSAKYGERFTLPSCPFSAVSGYTFNNYTCNGSTYSVGGGFTVTGDMTVTCNWNTINLSGRTVSFIYFCCNGGDHGILLTGYDPVLQGKVLNYKFNNNGIVMTNSLDIVSSNKSKKIVNMSGATFDPPATFECWIDGYAHKTYGQTSSSGTAVNYIL